MTYSSLKTRLAADRKRLTRETDEQTINALRIRIAATIKAISAGRSAWEVA